MNDFKFNYYLNLYKDKTMINRDEFRKNFKKKHGKYDKLEDLIIGIEKYQFKTYGQTLNSHFVYLPGRDDKRKENIRESNRKWNKKRYDKIL